MNVVLIFWGRSWWQSASVQPTSAAVTDQVRTMLEGPYLSALGQYGITNGALNSVVTAPSDPPAVFSDADLEGVVRSCVAARAIPHPRDVSDVYYALVIPPDVSQGQTGVFGAHWHIEIDGHKAAVGWSGNNGAIGNVTHAFSHELVEACTNPHGNGLSVKPGTAGGAELADVCEAVAAVYVRNVATATYWSQRDGRCIAPGGPDLFELWRARWSLGWTQFAPFTVAGQSHYLGYKASSGRAAIDRVRPNGIDVDSVWDGSWPKGYTSLAALQLPDGPYVLAHDSASHHTAIYKVHADGHGADLQWSATWGNGYTIIAPFKLAGDAYYLAYHPNAMALDRVNAGGMGVTTRYSSVWTPGWTHVVPFTDGSHVMYLAYKAGDGHAAIDRVHADGSGIDSLWTGAIDSAFTSIEPVTLGGRNYFLAYDAASGAARYYLRRPEDGALEVVWRGRWTGGWTSFVPFPLAGDKPCHLVYKVGDGTVAIERFAF